MIDDLIQDILLEMHGVKIEQTTLISSDDKTKMMILVFKDVKESDEAFNSYIKIIDFGYRLCNIHTNWKKSGLQFIITEFNSLFSIGKRMCWATVKDLYTSNSIPDLTSPEEAVKFMISSIRRCFEHGVYLNTIETMLHMAKNQLKRYYKFTKEVVLELTTMLNTSEDNLPYQLGFMPTTKPLETITFGPDLHMYKKENSEELKNFYKGVYTANHDYDSRRSRHYIPFDESGSGKFWLELPTRVDKKLIEMKNDFYQNILKSTQEDIIEEMNLEALNINLSDQDSLHHQKFKRSYFVGMNRKYEFQETMVVHSLVRALQMSGKKAVVFPKTKEQVEFEDIIHSTSSTKKEREMAQQDLDTFKVGVIEFVSFCKSRSNLKSSWSMMIGYKDICRISDDVEVTLKGMVKSLRMNHPTMRELRFNMEDYKSSFDQKDLMNFIFDRHSDFRNSSLKAFEKMCDLFGMKMTKVWENPFKFMRDIMKDKSYCYKTFTEFTKFMSKMAGNVQMTLLSDYPDSGNLKINLLNMYRSRTSPLFLLDYSKNTKPMKEDLDFLTKMSFKEWKANMNIKSVRIGMEDRKVTRARKLCTFGLYKDIKMEKVYSKRLFYKREYSKKANTTKYCWTDLSFLVLAEEFSEKGEKKINVDIKALDRNSVEDNSNFTSVIRFLSDNTGTEIQFTQRFCTSKEGLFMYSIQPNNMFFRMETKYYMMKYKVEMKVFYNKAFLKGARSMTFDIMEDSYSFDTSLLNTIRLTMNGIYDETILDAINDPPKLPVLDRILINNGWMSDMILETIDDITEEDMRTTDISLINKQFSMEGVMDMLPRMLSSGVTNMDVNSTSEELGNFNIKNINFPSLMSNLQNALKKCMMEEEEEVDFSSVEKSDTMSIMMMVEKVVKASTNSFLDMDLKVAKSLFRAASDRMSKFHNMMLWCIKDVLPDISDTMALMIYNIKLKEISLNTYINNPKDLQIVEPSASTKSMLRQKPVFSIVTENVQENLLSMLDDF
jgi:hypothetical protein